MNLENLNLVQSTLGNLQIFSFLHRKRRQNCTIQSPHFFLLLRIPGIDSTESIPCENSILLWNWFSETSFLCEGIEDFRIVVIIFCVWVKCQGAVILYMEGRPLLLSLWDFVHVSVFCTFRAYHGSCSSWVCQELASQLSSSLAGQAEQYSMAGPPIKKSFPLTLLQLGRARSRARSILCGLWPLFGQNISNTQTIWQLSAGDENSVPALKICIL